MKTLTGFWNQLVRIGLQDNPGSPNFIETQFVNQACFLSFFCTSLIAVATRIIIPQSPMYLYIFIIAVLFMLGVMLNAIKWYGIAKLYLFILIESALCWGSCAFGKDAGILNISLVLFLSPFIYFKTEEYIQKTVVFLLPIIGFGIMEYTSYELFDTEVILTPTENKAIGSVMLFATLTSYFFNILEYKRRLGLQTFSLEKKNDELIESINKVNKLNENLDKFVYTVSHDLRSPISSALGLIELSKSEKDINTIHEYMVIQEKSMRRMNDFVSDMLSYYKNSKAINYFENIDIEEFIKDIVEVNATLAAENKIQINISVHQPSKFRSDPMKLRIILNNLVSNAIRYYDDEKSDRHISIKIDASPQRATFVFEDNGIGISAESQEKVFEMFYRGTFKKSGSGLGLFMAKELVTKLNGTIQLESEGKVYTRFTVVLPNQLLV